MSATERSEPAPGPSVFAGEGTSAVAADEGPVTEAITQPVPPNPAPPAAVRANVEITCPGCGTISRFEELVRDADTFCRRCDYPLFWARGAVVALEAGEGGEGLRRLPGTAGRQAELSVTCRVCREPNRASAVICIRCGADLAPPPEPAPVVVAPAPPPPPEPEPEPEPESRWWIWLVAAGVVGLILLLWLLAIA